MVVAVARLIIFYLFAVMPVDAANWSVDGTVEQEFSYDDNVRMLADQSDASLIYKLVPDIHFSHKTAVFQLSANAAYELERFMAIPELDRDNQHYSLSGQYQMPRTVWRLNMAYNIAASRDTAEQHSGDFSTDSERISRSVSPALSYQLTEIDKLSVSVAYSDTTESDSAFNANTNRTVQVSWLRSGPERYSTGLSISYANYESTGLNSLQTSNSVGINCSATYVFSENWSLVGREGIRLTASETTSISALGAETTKFSSAGFTSETAIAYSGELLNGQLSFNQNLSPSSQGQLNEQRQVHLNLNYNMTERLSVALLTSYQGTESASNEGSAERINLTFQSSLSWKLAPDWRVSTHYQYQQQETTGSNETRVNSNRVMLSIQHNWSALNLAR